MKPKIIEEFKPNESCYIFKRKEAIETNKAMKHQPIYATNTTLSVKLSSSSSSSSLLLRTKGVIHLPIHVAYYSEAAYIDAKNIRVGESVKMLDKMSQSCRVLI
jgi:hypothetical protein